MLTCLICHSSDNKCSQIEKERRISQGTSILISVWGILVSFTYIYRNIHEHGMFLLINFNGIPHTTVWAVFAEVFPEVWL